MIETALLQFVATVGEGIVGVGVLVGFVLIALGTWRMLTEYHG